MVLLDDRKDAIASGFHDLTNEGLPQALVFVGEQDTSGRGADQWTLSASHELLEMLADPDLCHATSMRLPEIKRMLKAIASGHPFPESDEVFCALEICDPCGAVEHGYRINGVLVSDFVYPAWFESFHRNSRLKNQRSFDHAGFIVRPFQALRGGYAIVYGDGQWRLHVPSTGAAAPGNGFARTRRERRITRRDQWKRSRQ